MKRIHTIELTGAGSRKTMTRGSVLELDKGRKMSGMRLKFTVPVNNTTGGAVALSDAQKQALLDQLSFWVNYGSSGQHKAFEAEPGSRMHREARFAYGSEIEGYTDTVTGLQRSLPNTATTNVTFYLPIPLGKLWFLPPEAQRLFGMGRSQARTLQIEIALNGLAIAANLAINGTVTAQFFPETESCKGDPWGAVPHFRKFDSTSDTVSLTEGVPLRIVERTNVHASSALTNFGLKIGEEVIHESVSPQDTITEYNDNAYANAAGSLVDRETILYALAPGLDLRELPAGSPQFRQYTKDMSTVQLAQLFLPVLEKGDIEDALAFAVSAGARKKELKAVTIAAARGIALPERLAPVLGVVFFDTQDGEWERFGGLKRAPGDASASVVIPEGLRDRAQKLFKLHDAANEKKAAESVVKAVTATIPGGVPSLTGFGAGASPFIDRVRGLIR